jgi:hypothetical protein
MHDESDYVLITFYMKVYSQLGYQKGMAYI